VTSSDALVRSLLEPLLDARRQAATEQFDETLSAALGAGRITPELARELRFWQRASVHEVTDHVRTVLPAVLPVALEAVAEATRDADEAAAGAMAAWQDRTPVVEEPITPPTVQLIAEEPDEPDVPVSTPLPDGAAMSPHARRRMFVAGLTSTA
jgi:hypothetical protein